MNLNNVMVFRIFDTNNDIRVPKRKQMGYKCIETVFNLYGAWCLLAPFTIGFT